MKSGNTDKPPS